MLYLYYTVAFHTGPGKERKKKINWRTTTNNQAMNKHRTKRQTPGKERKKKINWRTTTNNQAMNKHKTKRQTETENADKSLTIIIAST